MQVKMLRTRQVVANKEGAKMVAYKDQILTLPNPVGYQLIKAGDAVKA